MLAESFGPSEFITVSIHAMKRRLQFERVPPNTMTWMLHERQDLIVDQVRAEIARSQRLDVVSRRVFIHPGREARIGQRFTKRQRTEHPKISSYGTARSESCYYLYGDQFCYVVDHRTVATMIVPTINQIETLERLMGHLPDAPRVSLWDEAHRTKKRPKALTPMQTGTFRKNVARDVRQNPLSVPATSRLPIAWTLIVVDEVEDPHVFARQVMNRIRSVYPGGLPQPVFVDPRVVPALGELDIRLKHVMRCDLPKLPEDWPTLLPNARKMHRWWKRVVDLAQGTRLLLVAPETAIALKAIAEPAPDAHWRRDPRVVEPGAVLTLNLDPEADAPGEGA